MYLTHSDKFDFKNVNPAARGSLASVRDELGNRRLRRSSGKGGVGGLGGGGTQKIIGFNPIKARIHAGQSQKSIQISCNAEHPR